MDRKQKTKGTSMLTIVQLERGANKAHGMQSQSGRTACWLEGWIILPEHLKEAFQACGGWCELVVEDGTVTGVVPDEENPSALYAAIREKEEEQARLKEELSATDYRVLKCYEAALLGQEPPYDVEELTARRQAQRSAVNAAGAERAALEESVRDYLAG